MTGFIIKNHRVIFYCAWFLLNLLQAGLTGLLDDEAYYWVYAQYPAWGYFDHPPMIAFWIRLFTANLLLEDVEGFVRLGSLIGCALSSWFIFKTCTSEDHKFITVKSTKFIFSEFFKTALLKLEYSNISTETVINE